MTELRTWVRGYDSDRGIDLIYDTTTYTPVLTAPEGGWTYENKLELEQKANDQNLQFARTTKGEIWKIALYQFNKKSITLNDGRTPPHGGRQRIRYEELESLGTCRHDHEPAEDGETPSIEPIKQEIRKLQDKMGDNKITVSVSPAPNGGDPDRPAMLIKRAAEELGITEEQKGEPAAAEAPAHAERDHALLSASGAHRWINCTPSAVIEDRYPDSDSDAAAEGTAAHELAEHKLLTLMGAPSARPDSQWFNEDMEDHTDSYADHVMAELHRTKQTSPGAFLAVEQRLDFSHIVPDGFGTGDALIVGDDTMTIVDLKYGKGVKVDAADNPQMMLYALGALAQFGMIYDIKTVRMVIFQPRIDNISTHEVTVEELLEWAEDVARPAAEKAIAGEGELQAGEWCQFCRHSAQCPALAAAMFAPVPKDENQVPAAPDPDTLSDEQIAQIVTWAGELKKWLGKVEAHALDKANQGHQYPGLKLVEGRSVRKYTDKGVVAHIVEDDTEHSPYKPREVLGITDMTELLGKKRFEELLGDYVHKPAGKPTLVPVSDKRPALTVATPETVFEPIEQGA